MNILIARSESTERQTPTPHREPGNILRLALPILLVVTVLFAGCATPDAKRSGIVSERIFRERVLKKYASDPTFPLYTLYVGVVQDADGRVTKIW